MRRPIAGGPIEAASGALKGRIPASEKIRARAREDERRAIREVIEQAESERGAAENT